MMVWLEPEEDAGQTANPSQTLDYAYRILCDSIPSEHTYLLGQAITAILPWLDDEPSVGIHGIHIPNSGNGWIRPTGEGDDNLLYLSRRTRLVLRLSKDLLLKARSLEEASLIIGGHTLVVGKGQEKPLLPSSTLFSRHIVTGKLKEESRFIDYLVDQFQQLGIEPRKILCGRSRMIWTPKTPIHTRSVLIAELNPKESLRLQQNGIGPNRLLGCGLFIPHKSIAPVSKA